MPRESFSKTFFIREYNKPREQEEIFSDEKTRGLYLKFRKSKGSYSFFVKGVLNGKRKQFPVNDYKEHIENSSDLSVAIEQIQSTARTMMLAIKQGRDPRIMTLDDEREMTTNQFAKIFFEEYGENNLTPVVKKKYQSMYENHVKPIIGDYRMRHTEYSQVLKIHRLASTPRTVDNPNFGKVKFARRRIDIGGDTAANRTIEMLSSFFTYAQKRIGLDKNPVEHFDLEDRNDEAIRDVIMIPSDFIKFYRLLYLSRIELQHLEIFDREKYHNDYTYRRAMDYMVEAQYILKIALLGGPRKGEIFKSRIDDFDYKESMWTKHDTKAVKRKRKKRKATYQKIYIPVELTETIKEWLVVRRSHQRFQIMIEEHGAYSEYLFPHEQDMTKPRSKVDKAKDKILKAAGIKDHYTMHDIRRTFTTYNAEMGTDFRNLAKHVGHTNERTTEENYVHTTAANTKEFAESTVKYIDFVHEKAKREVANS